MHFLLDIITQNTYNKETDDKSVIVLSSPALLHTISVDVLYKCHKKTPKKYYTKYDNTFKCGLVSSSLKKFSDLRDNLPKYNINKIYIMEK